MTYNASKAELRALASQAVEQAQGKVTRCATGARAIKPSSKATRDAKANAALGVAPLLTRLF